VFVEVKARPIIVKTVHEAGAQPPDYDGSAATGDVERPALRT
jgi:hypothetical protein